MISSGVIRWSSVGSASPVVVRAIWISSASDGIVQLDQEHEPVELRLGQRIGPFLLDRVLRGQHEERRLEVERLADHRDVLLLHRLEQGRLRLRRGAVDLVGQHDVGEDRPVDELELAPAVRPCPGGCRCR